MEEPGKPVVARKLGRAKRIAFSLVLVALVYGVVEVAAWAAFPYAFNVPFSFDRLQQERASFIPKEVPDQERPAHLAISAIHPYLGYVTDPEIANRSTKQYNDHGLYHLDAIVPKRRSDQVIVGIAGGSVATFFSERGVEALRRELASSRRYAGKEPVFVNLAHGGYKQPQQLIALNYFLAQGAEFDLLINIDGFNEIALYPRFNATDEVFPLFPANWHLITNVPDARERELIAAQAVHRMEKRALAKRFARSPWCYSVTANFLWKWFDRQTEASLAACHDVMLAHRHETHYQSVGPRANFGDEDSTAAELVAIWQRCSLQLDRLCRANGIAYYHFLQPNQYVPGSKEMGAEERHVAFLDNHVMKTCVEQHYSLLQRGSELVRQGVRFHDLTMVFAEHPEPVYYDTCCHINKHGNEIMAHEVARILLATPEPPQAPPLAN